MIKGKPLHILLVEDDEAHAEIVRRNLEDYRIANRLTHVADGQAALDYLYCESESSAPKPDLILLDLRLPKVDGLQVLQEIKAHPELKSIPTVILTTSAAESDVLNAYKEGAGSFLEKPVDINKFTALLEKFGYYWLAWTQSPYDEGE